MPHQHFLSDPCVHELELQGKVLHPVLEGLLQLLLTYAGPLIKAAEHQPGIHPHLKVQRRLWGAF